MQDAERQEVKGQAMEQSDVILSMEHIDKVFPGVKALSDVSLEVRRGEVHALMGENGAGKSTLMKVLYGIYPCDGGTITFDGKTVGTHTQHEALHMGIAMIHQEISLATNMSVAENIWVGRTPMTKLGLVDFKKLYAMTQEILDDVGLDIDPKVKVRDLSVAQMQMVEVARAVSYNAKLIIMDEPTSSLSKKEIQVLYRIIRTLKSRQVSVIIITHKIDEVFEISDRITVLRDGRRTGDADIHSITEDDLIRMMVGRELTEMFPKQESEIGEVLLEVEHLSSAGVFEDVSFCVHRGEILGVSGLIGAGRTEIMKAVFGIDRKDSGTIRIGGEPVNIRSPRDAIAHGIAMVTEDRKMEGLSLVRSSKENMTIVNLNEYSRGGIVNSRAELSDVEKMIRMLAIKLSSPKQVVNSLSGGNQQKVIIAKWLLKKPKILIIDEPTRGIDVGAKSEIHRIISSLACQGMAVILVSSELPEILGMSDRVIVIHEGHLKGELTRQEATQEKIMALSATKKEGA